MVDTNRGSNLEDNPQQSVSIDASPVGSSLSTPDDHYPNITERMLRLLGNTDQPMLSYIWRAWLMALIPSLALTALVALSAVFRGTSGQNPPLLGESPWGITFGALIFSPWLETLLMWPILGLVKIFTQKPLEIAVASGLIWGGLHSLAMPGWGLTTWWPFVVFSLCFMAWQKKSVGRAITVTALVHTCHNALAIVFVLLPIFLLGIPSSESTNTHPGPGTSRSTVEQDKIKAHPKAPIPSAPLQQPASKKAVEATAKEKPLPPRVPNFRWGYDALQVNPRPSSSPLEMKKNGSSSNKGMDEFSRSQRGTKPSGPENQKYRWGM